MGNIYETKGKKQEELNELKKDLNDAKNMFVTPISGDDCRTDTELHRRSAVRTASIRVVKNTLARKACRGNAGGRHGQVFDGSTAIAYNGSDPVALAKCLPPTPRQIRSSFFKAAWSKPCGEYRRHANIAAMPSKEELIAKLLFLINSPAQRLVVAMNGVARNLAVVLGQAIEKKKFQNSYSRGRWPAF